MDKQTEFETSMNLFGVPPEVVTLQIHGACIKADKDTGKIKKMLPGDSNGDLVILFEDKTYLEMTVSSDPLEVLQCLVLIRRQDQELEAKAVAEDAIAQAKRSNG